MKTALLFTFALLTSSVHAGSCCSPAPKVESAPAACCPTPASASATGSLAERELPPSDFTRDSLYQLDATFTDDAGRPFTLAQLRGKPVVLAMFFASCNYACPLLVADMTRLRDALPAELRTQVSLVLVSIDPVRDTPAALRKFREERLLDTQWTLLHGDDDAVHELAALVGVKFKLQADGQFAHSNLLTILNAQGEIAHQRAGLQGGLLEAAAALVASTR